MHSTSRKLSTDTIATSNKMPFQYIIFCSLFKCHLIFTSHNTKTVADTPINDNSKRLNILGSTKNIFKNSCCLFSFSDFQNQTL